MVAHSDLCQLLVGNNEIHDRVWLLHGQFIESGQLHNFPLLSSSTSSHVTGAAIAREDIGLANV